MTYAYDVKNWGFEVLPFPEKPDYLPISDEEFRQDTLSAWCRGGYREKIAAALYGGEREWAALYKDSDLSVRAAVACRGSESIQLKMLSDPEPLVRKLLARHGTDKVRAAAINGWEANTEVLMEIAKWGNAATKRKVLELAWSLPETLKKVIPFLSPGCIKKLEIYPDRAVRYEAAMHGGLAQCQRFLDAIRKNRDADSWLMRQNVQDRIDELSKVKKSLLGGLVRSRKYAEMER
ncbi:hypothetical protein AALD01_05110 [Oscillospiraceae bacterium 21-37]